jgi:HAD superfamily hydrolase (TIGR01549 family)
VPGFIFDLDGTLVDTVQPHTVVWQRVLANAGIVVPANRIQFWIGAGSKKLAQACLRRGRGAVSPDQLEQMRGEHQRMMQQWANPPIVLPGARELLRFLSEQGVPWGIATSGRRPAVDHAIEALGVVGCPLVTFHDVSRNKPDPQALLLCANRIGLPPPDCVMVGDAVWDILAALNAKMLPVAVKTGGASERRLKRAGARFLARDPADLLRRIPEIMIALES